MLGSLGGRDKSERQIHEHLESVLWVRAGVDCADWDLRVEGFYLLSDQVCLVECSKIVLVPNVDHHAILLIDSTGCEWENRHI